MKRPQAEASVGWPMPELRFKGAWLKCKSRPKSGRNHEQQAAARVKEAALLVVERSWATMAVVEMRQ